MKHLLLITIAAVVLVGCGESQQSTPGPESKPVEPVVEVAKPEPPTAKAPDASLWDAAMFGKIEAAKKAIADGANVNAKKDDAETPLHRATVEAMDSGSKKVIELLIENGADVNAKIVDGRKKGMTPLAIANMFSNKEIAHTPPAARLRLL